MTIHGDKRSRVRIGHMVYAYLLYKAECGRRPDAVKDDFYREQWAEVEAALQTVDVSQIRKPMQPLEPPPKLENTFSASWNDDTERCQEKASSWKGEKASSWKGDDDEKASSWKAKAWHDDGDAKSWHDHEVDEQAKAWHDKAGMSTSWQNEGWDVDEQAKGWQNDGWEVDKKANTWHDKDDAKSWHSDEVDQNAKSWRHKGDAKSWHSDAGNDGSEVDEAKSWAGKAWESDAVRQIAQTVTWDSSSDDEPRPSRQHGETRERVMPSVAPHRAPNRNKRAKAMPTMAPRFFASPVPEFPEELNVQWMRPQAVQHRKPVKLPVRFKAQAPFPKKLKKEEPI